MKAVKINERLTVADQPMIAEFNRSPHRALRPSSMPTGWRRACQTGNAQKRSAAQAAGMDYGLTPVTGRPSPKQISAPFKRKWRKRKGVGFCPLQRAARVRSHSMCSEKHSRAHRARRHRSLWQCAWL